ncbi:MAG: ABC transporter permease [Candidatus Methanomethylicota archaeon]|uniref:ABC transporter permease n=1 Tax=Thermoproteota archaeon TaxID=2056631 RepID=A0A497EUM5_9CREN|nr:MAG: ABC transporter permease [Candidatus Verstraetearchaeota archaeon]
MSILVLAERDLNRFWKYKWWLAGIVAMNLSDLLIMALIFGNIVRREYISNYMQFVAPGITIMALFLSAFSIGREAAVEIRRGYYQYLLSLPISDWQIVIGKILAGTIRGLIYVAPFIILTFAIVGLPNLLGVALIVIAIVLTAASMSSLGIALAPLAKRLDIYITIRSLIYFLVFFFSTIFYPESALLNLAKMNRAFYLVYYVAKINPASIAAEIIRNALNIPQSACPDIPTFVTINLLLIIIGTITYVRVLRRK